MSYSIDIDPAAQDAIAALPVDALLALAEVFAVLEVAPWNAGRSVNPERNTMCHPAWVWEIAPNAPTGVGGRGTVCSYLTMSSWALNHARTSDSS